MHRTDNSGYCSCPFRNPQRTIRPLPAEQMCRRPDGHGSVRHMPRPHENRHTLPGRPSRCVRQTRRHRSAGYPALPLFPPQRKTPYYNTADRGYCPHPPKCVPIWGQPHRNRHTAPHKTSHTAQSAFPYHHYHDTQILPPDRLLHIQNLWYDACRALRRNQNHRLRQSGRSPCKMKGIYLHSPSR